MVRVPDSRQATQNRWFFGTFHERRLFRAPIASGWAYPVICTKTSATSRKVQEYPSLRDCPVVGQCVWLGRILLAILTGRYRLPASFSRFSNFSWRSGEPEYALLGKRTS